MLSKQQPIRTDLPSSTELPLSQTDPEAAKQQSAAQKLELFETIKGMQEGRMPHNDQLDSLLESLINNRVIRSREHRMSQDGKNLLNDFRALLDTLRKSLQVKNKDELFQSFVYHLHCMDIPVSKEQLSSSVNEADKNIIKQEGKKGSQALYNIGKLILLNNEFRSLLGELIDISQNIFSSMTDQIGEDLKQTGDKMKDSTDMNRSGKEKVDNILMGHQQTPEEPHLINENATDPTHAGLLNTGDSVHPDILATNQMHVDQMHQHGKERLPGSHSNQLHANQILSNGPDKMNHLGNSMQHQAQEHKVAAMQHLGNRKQGFNHTVQENFDDNKQDELLDRLRNAIGQVQRHPKYQEAIMTLIDLTKTWSNRLVGAREHMKEHVQSQDSHEQASYRDRAEMELKTLIEGWAQGNSLDPILEGLQTVMDDAKNDEVLSQYYDTALKYVNRLLRDPDYINSEDSTEDGQQLIDIGRQLMKGKYGDHYQYFSNHVRQYMHLLADDDISREINDRFTQIHQDLWMDSEGNPAFKPHLVNDMQKTLLPAFLDEIKYIPIPRIEFNDKQFDVIIENMIISGETLIPNVFDVKAESFASFNFKSDEDTSASHQSLLIRMSEIQADINDVIFCYKKKTGFPKVDDRGVASLTIDKKGISIVIRIQNTNNPAKTFKVTYCKCHVDHIKVKVNDSKHDILYKAVLPLVMGTIRKQIARAIEMKIIETLNTLDQKVTTSLVNMNQKLQNKAYEALPESEKANPNMQPEQLSQARPRPGLFSTLVTVINRNIQSKTEKRNVEKKYKKSDYSPVASMKTDRYHALHDTASNKGNDSFRHQLSSSQLKSHPEVDSNVASNSLNDKYTNPSLNAPSNNATIASNQSTIGDSSSYQHFNGMDSNSQVSDDISKIPHPSAASNSSYDNPSNGTLPESSVTGTHNTLLNHGNTISQDASMGHTGMRNTGHSFNNNIMEDRQPINASDSITSDGLRSSFSQTVPKHSPSFDSNNGPTMYPSTKDSTTTTVNNNGIDNQHFKLAMDLGEAQNPNAPMRSGRMEGTRQV